VFKFSLLIKQTIAKSVIKFLKILNMMNDQI
jgi:hypothetical protein